MKSIVQFEDENRIELQSLFDRLVGFDKAILDKLDYRNLVIFMYSLNRN